MGGEGEVKGVFYRGVGEVTDDLANSVMCRAPLTGSLAALLIRCGREGERERWFRNW